VAPENTERKRSKRQDPEEHKTDPEMGNEIKGKFTVKRHKRLGRDSLRIV
jgi:hypothetical protein